MVAYSFQPGFLDAIRAGEKRQTIRLPRKRHARAGEQLQFFTGPRMKPVRVGGATCVAARDARLDFKANRVTLDDAVEIEGDEALDVFALRDGFRPPAISPVIIRPWSFMKRWWAITHPGQPVFRGVLIDWGESFKAAADSTLRACRSCGCSETNACTVRDGQGSRGCAWVERDLCDACADPSIRLSGPRVFSGSAA